MSLRTIFIIQMVLLVVAIFMIATVAMSYWTLKNSVQTLQTERAHLQANVPLMGMTINDDASVVDNLNAASNVVCGQKGMAVDTRLSEEQRTGLLQICGVMGLAPETRDATVDFYKAYNKALGARLSAKSAQDYKKVLTLYETALKLSEQKSGNYELVDKHWRIRALEGNAYAQMRLGNFPAAMALASQAIDLVKSDKNFDVFVFANLTKIKTMCLTKADGSKVRGEYNSLLGSLEAIAKRAAPESPDHKYAEEDLETARQDGEVAFYCQYANLGQ